MSALDDRVRAGFAAAFGGAPDGVVRAPGRVNLIGEHTDYNDGFVLPCAIGVETRIAYRARADLTVRAVACEFGSETDQFTLTLPVERRPHAWRDYVRAMVSTLMEDGHTLRGVDMAIGGDIPRGAGLSSSASLEVAVANVMLAVAWLPVDPVRVAVLAQAAENEFVGMKCGVMDQLASSASVEGAALLIDCRSLAVRPVPIPAGTAIAIVHSGVVRGLVEGHYNRRRAECEEAAAILGVPKLRDADLATLETARGAMTDTVFRRARHIVTENARVLQAADALVAGDLRTMGRLMAESHASMRDDFAITVPKVDELAHIAGDAIATLDGGYGGARMTGGGFGGALVVLMRESAAAAIGKAIGDRYRTPDGAPPVVMIARAAAGASRIE